MAVHELRVTKSSRITVPEDVMRTLGVNPGDKVAFEVRGSEVWLKRATPDSESSGDATEAISELPQDPETFTSEEYERDPSQAQDVHCETAFSIEHPEPAKDLFPIRHSCH